MPMTISRDELREIMMEIFEERSKIDSVEHLEHHQWIQERIKAEYERREMYREITKIVIQYSIPAILAGTYYWLQGHWK
jgi:hypothetical protein